MRDLDQDFLDVIAGTQQRIVEVNVWRDGEVIAPAINVTGGAVSFDLDADMTRMIEGVRVATDDLDLPPYSPAAGLAPYGQRLEVRVGAMVGGEPRLTRVGFILIDHADVDEMYYTDARGVMQRAPALVPVDGVDLMQVIGDLGLIVPEQPAAGATCLGEIRRLVGQLLPWRGGVGVTDRGVPSTVTYTTDSGSRLKAVQDLAAAMDARCRVDDDGYFVVVPRALPTEPQWRVETAGVTDGRSGQIIRLSRKMSRSGVYNVVIARGQAASDAAPVQGIAYDTYSAAKYGGPFGGRSYIHSSPLLTSQASADQAAATRLNNLIAGRDIEVTAQIVPHPGIEVGDLGVLASPFEEFTGVVRSLRLPLTPGGLMDITMSVAVGDVAQVSRRPADG